MLCDAGDRLGIALAPLVGSLGLEAVIITGLPESFTQPVLSSASEALKFRLTRELFESLSLRVTDLGDDIALRGSVILVINRVLGIS